MNHGATYHATGSGFGVKTSNTHKWDDASGTSPSAIWDYAWPDSAPSGYNMGYYAPSDVPGGGVALPHSHVSKYLTGAHHTSGVHTGTFVHVADDYTFVEANWHIIEYYNRLANGWVFDPTPSVNNHKRLAFSRGFGSPLGDGTEQAYHEYRGDGDFSSESGNFQTHTNPDSANSWAANYYGIGPNPFVDWFKEAQKIKWSAGASGRLYLEQDYSVIMDSTEKTDALPGTTDRCIGIGTYAGNRDPANRRYFADVYSDYGPNDGAFYLSNNATWASRTISEIQHYTAWTATDVTLVCNAGRLSNGTVHLHYRSIVNGNQYLGTQTLGSSSAFPIRGFKV